MAKKCSVDKDACIGCGMCMGMHPEAFDLGDDGKATVIGGDEAAHEECAASCPVAAIKVED